MGMSERMLVSTGVFIPRDYFVTWDSDGTTRRENTHLGYS